MSVNEEELVEEKTVNEHFEFDDVVSIYLRFQRFIGILPFEGRDYNYFGSRILLSYFFLASFINWSMFTFYCFNTNNLQADALIEAIVVVTFNSRFYIIIRRRFEFLEIVNECRLIWNEFCAGEAKYRETVMAFERKLRILLVCYLGSTTFINVLYPAVALTTKIPPSEPNGTYGRILPYKFYDDCDVSEWPDVVYGLIFAMQMLVVQNAVVLGVTVDIVPSLLIMITCAYFRNICDRIFRKRIQHIFGWHQVDQYRDKYKYLSVIATCLCQLFICQWGPDHLFTESAAVSEAVYSASFTWLKHRFGKMIIIIIQRAQNPVQMTAGGIVDLSLANFNSMITSAFSFFTVLRNFNL